MTEQKTKEVIKKETAVAELKHLNDLTKEAVEKFPLYTIRFAKSEKNNFTRVSATLHIDKSFMKIPLTSYNRREKKIEPISLDLWSYIASTIKLDMVEPNGRPKADWTKKAYCRFVKGTREDGTQWKAIQVVFSLGMTHIQFFNGLQIGTLDNLEKDHLIKIDWQEMADKVEVAEVDEDSLITV